MLMLTGPMLAFQIVMCLVKKKKSNSHWVKWRELSVTNLQQRAQMPKKEIPGGLLHIRVISFSDRRDIEDGLECFLFQSNKYWDNFWFKKDSILFKTCTLYIQPSSVRGFQRKLWAHLNTKYPYFYSPVWLVSNSWSHKEFQKCASLRSSEVETQRCFMCLHPTPVLLIGCWHGSSVNSRALVLSAWAAEKWALRFQDVKFCLISVNHLLMSRVPDETHPLNEPCDLWVCAYKSSGWPWHHVQQATDGDQMCKAAEKTLGFDTNWLTVTFGGTRRRRLEILSSLAGRWRSVCNVIKWFKHFTVAKSISIPGPECELLRLRTPIACSARSDFYNHIRKKV